MKQYINLGVLVLTSMLFGCNDNDFLNENPETFYTIDNSSFGFRL